MGEKVDYNFSNRRDRGVSRICNVGCQKLLMFFFRSGNFSTLSCARKFLSFIFPSQYFIQLSDAASFQSKIHEEPEEATIIQVTCVRDIRRRLHKAYIQPCETVGA